MTSHLSRGMRHTAAALVLGAALASSPAAAQMPVLDPANLTQNLLQAAHALEQIHNQIQQIEQQAKMLSANGLQLSPELERALARARALLDDASALKFEMDKVSADARALYPEVWSAFNLAEIGPRTTQWLAEDRASLERALRAQAQSAASLDANRQRLSRALGASADAEGQTSAVQAGNQILGVSAAQLADIHALLIAQGRALTTERLERVARETRAREIQRRAFPSAQADVVAPARPAFND